MATVKVGADGKAQKGLSVGDVVETQGGNYTITGVNADGSYQSQKVGSTPTVNNNYVGRSGMDYSSTSGDVGTAMKNAMASGASADTVASMLADRTYKASSTSGLQQYAYDSLYDEANAYIRNKYAQEQEDAYNRGKAEEQNKNQNKYTSSIDNLVNQILNGSYQNYLQSDEYNALAQQYNSNGQRAMKDTLAEVSNRTGGLASSYATTASNQAYNNYMEALNQASLSAYNQQQNSLMNKLNLLQSLDDVAYSRSRDTLADERYADELAYSRNQDEYSKLLANAQILANYGDFSGYQALGYTPSQITAMQNAYTLANTKSSRSSGGSGGYTTTNYGGVATATELNADYQNWIASGLGPNDFFANGNYKNYTNVATGKAYTKADAKEATSGTYEIMIIQTMIANGASKAEVNEAINNADIDKSQKLALRQLNNGSAKAR